MIFTDLAGGDAVFVDANTLVYHFSPDPQIGTLCSNLLIRIKRQEIEGYTSTDVVSEMAHRLMTVEAMKFNSWPVTGIAQRLRKSPAVVQRLTAFRQAIQEIPGFGLRILTIVPDLLDAGAAISQATGLLTNDALIVAVMQSNGLSKIASSDIDFDRVPDITRYGPA